MATKPQMTGMLGVYLVAAELSRRELIVSITSRSARGADLLATDLSFRHTWSIQVKTNRKPAGFWLLSSSYRDDVAPTHVYVFVNVRGAERPDYYIVPSAHVAEFGKTSIQRTGTVFHSFYRNDAGLYLNNWAQFERVAASD